MGKVCVDFITRFPITNFQGCFKKERKKYSDRIIFNNKL